MNSSNNLKPNELSPKDEPMSTITDQKQSIDLTSYLIDAPEEMCSEVVNPEVEEKYKYVQKVKIR